MLHNSGLIESTGTGQAIDFGDLISPLGQISITNDAAAVIRAADSDAIRSGANATINNSGQIVALSAGSAESDGIDFESNGGGVVNNFSGGTVEGARYGITGDQAFVVNNSGTITGGTGAGIGAFGGSTISNNGTITSANGQAIVTVGLFTDVITNNGTIIGSISTGGGGDVLNLQTGSSITGLIDTGTGLDTINLDGSSTGSLTSFTGVEFINLLSGDWTIGSEGVTTLAFQAGAQTLRLTSGVLANQTFAGTIDNFEPGDVIDLQGVGIATAATLGAGNLLTISGTTGGPILLQLDPSDDYTGLSFQVASDGAGGTLVTLDVVPVGGGGGSQTITGTSGADNISAGAGDDAINAGDGNDIVSAGNGNDTVIAGLGDDTVNAGNGTDTINAGDGNDTVISGNGSDTVVAGGGNDTVDAGNGSDRVVGGLGNDILTGGNGNDVFVFKASFGDDTVTDFRNGDVIEFDASAFANFAAIQNASQQVGSDVVITLQGGDTVTLQNVALNSLDASDFILT